MCDERMCDDRERERERGRRWERERERERKKRREEKKFKNAYAGRIWAASGKSLLGGELDLAWIFAFFQKYCIFGYN